MVTGVSGHTARYKDREYVVFFCFFVCLSNAKTEQWIDVTLECDIEATFIHGKYQTFDEQLFYPCES